MKKIIIALSVLSANFLALQDDLQVMQDNGITWIHYDVMDNNFVPNLSFGPYILSQISSKFAFNVDIHLMVLISRPLEEYLAPFIATKPRQMTLHFEALTSEQIFEFIAICHSHKIMASIAIKPNTSVDVLKPYLDQLDNILVMSVEPGFGGQQFIESCADKVKILHDLRQKHNYQYRLEIDGGINDTTMSNLNKTGIDMVVAGSYLFGKNDIKERMAKIEYVED